MRILSSFSHCKRIRFRGEDHDHMTVEFVNDAGLDPKSFASVYSEILQRIRSLGAECILITPNFTMPEMMGMRTIQDPAPRRYVHELHDYAECNALGLVDVSLRWEQLAGEEIPNVTMLKNAINHPDNRGHTIYADELMRCFR